MAYPFLLNTSQHSCGRPEESAVERRHSFCCYAKTVTGKKNIVNNLRFFGLLNPEEENLSFLKL
jgi:hypothetical protein